MKTETKRVDDVEKMSLLLMSIGTIMYIAGVLMLILLLVV